MASPTPENLQRLAALLADGNLRIPVQATYDLAQAPEALTALAGTHTQGKLAIQVRGAPEPAATSVDGPHRP
jgi:NADPH:quinone reductase-like Zn-dependent oxidoreductase